MLILRSMVIFTYHPVDWDSFTDPDWGAATANQAIKQGADVVFGAGGSTSNGALIETATVPGKYCIGVDTDQWELFQMLMHVSFLQHEIDHAQGFSIFSSWLR